MKKILLLVAALAACSTPAPPVESVLPEVPHVALAQPWNFPPGPSPIQVYDESSKLRLSGALGFEGAGVSCAYSTLKKRVVCTIGGASVGNWTFTNNTATTSGDPTVIGSGSNLKLVSIVTVDRGGGNANQVNLNEGTDATPAIRLGVSGAGGDGAVSFFPAASSTADAAIARGGTEDLRLKIGASAESAFTFARDAGQGWATLSSANGTSETSLILCGLGGCASNRIGLQGNAFATVTGAVATLTMTGSYASFGVPVVNTLAPAGVVGSPIAAAATIAPTAPITHITGHAAAISTITAPAIMASNGGWLTLVCDDALITWTSVGGNLGVSGACTTAGSAVTFYYDNNTSKWYPSRIQ